MPRKPSGRPPGRPVVPDEDRLVTILHVRVAAEQRAWLLAYARERGMASASDALRHVLARVMAGTPPPGPPAPPASKPVRVYGKVKT